MKFKFKQIIFGSFALAGLLTFPQMGHADSFVNSQIQSLNQMRSEIQTRAGLRRNPEVCRRDVTTLAVNRMAALRTAILMHKDISNLQQVRILNVQKTCGGPTFVESEIRRLRNESARLAKAAEDMNAKKRSRNVCTTYVNMMEEKRNDSINSAFALNEDTRPLKNMRFSSCD